MKAITSQRKSPFFIMMRRPSNAWIAGTCDSGLSSTIASVRPTAIRMRLNTAMPVRFIIPLIPSSWKKTTAITGIRIDSTEPTLPMAARQPVTRVRSS